MASPDNPTGSRPSTGATAAGSTAAGATGSGSYRASADTRSSDRVDAARETAVPPYQARQRDDSEARDRFGGINWGAGFFGWLVAIGMTIILSGIVGAILTAVGSQIDITLRDAKSAAGSIGIGAGITLLVVLMLAYFTGGYVAGRMSRFDGARQGVATWVIGLLVTLLVAALGAIAGDKYDIFDRISLPRLPLNLSELGTGGAITAVAVLLGTLLAAVIGGKVGHRYHDKVDRAAGITR
jgi:amino acid transporter